ncbi:type I restriction enzyme, S subunit [Xylanibacter ruminicola]|uniref:Type I restriction enzyme, S subunit n=2 Tax=Xylanibacter ruminicola TaxID=839 RepID=A0A1H5VX23_XYLRU|nr:type I restriction enzyme, S subunit [Xylanibacter ruminicola]
MDKSKWEYKKLGDIALISAGQGAPQGENNYSPEGTPFVKAGNIESLINGLSEYDIQKVNDAVVKSHRLKLYKAGSVLFAKSGMSCMKGLVYTLKNDCYVVSHLAIVTPKDINSHYLNYYFQVHKPNSLIKDSAYPSISLKDIENLIILCPSQTDQQRIVAELDCLNEMIAVKQEQLKEFDKLAQSIFYDMFGDSVSNEKGWEKHSLGKMATFKNGLNFKPVDEGNSIKILGVSDFQDLKEIKTADSLSLKCIKETVDDDYYLTAGDIVIVRSNGSKKLVGRNVLIRFKDKNVAYSGFCIRCRLTSDECLPLYLNFVLSTPSMKELMTSGGRGCNIANINQQALNKLMVPLPPLTLQQQFAEKIQAIEAQKELVKKSIAETQHLLDSRMDFYFN